MSFQMKGCFSQNLWPQQSRIWRENRAMTSQWVYGTYFISVVAERSNGIQSSFVACKRTDSIIFQTRGASSPVALSALYTGIRFPKRYR